MTVMLGTGALLGARGVSGNRPKTAVAGGSLLAATLLFFGFMGFYGEYLWFESLGFGERFRTELAARAGFAALGCAGAGALFWMLTIPLKTAGFGVRKASAASSALFGAIWGNANWSVILQYWRRAASEIRDPVFHKDISFYFFSLPFYEQMAVLLFATAVFSIAAHLLSCFVRFDANRFELEPVPREERQSAAFRSLLVSGGGVSLLFAFGSVLKRFGLLTTGNGTVTGAGWTDVHVRIPALNLLAVLFTAAAIVLFTSAVFWKRAGRFTNVFRVKVPVAGAGVIFSVWLIGTLVLPALFQWLRVEPNEITMEKPFIRYSIDGTRKAFKLDGAEEKQFPASSDFNRDMVERNPDLFGNIRLWDWRALMNVYNQFQEIRLYYEFDDVDIDRYVIDGRYRQVMASAREMEIANLPRQSRTFVNKRFKYTHGYGITLTAVHDFTPEGLPRLLIKDIPPKHLYPELEVTRPEIYYGELTTNPVIVNSSEKEFDYPRGDRNTYVHYEGSGGVRMKNLWRKFVFGWKFDGARLLFSSYPEPESRMMFHRRIRDRAETVAPFLEYDRDPYIVLVEGKLYWILDAYTARNNYPYSESFSASDLLGPGKSHAARSPFRPRRGYGKRINYLRNSVKVVVDAYEGSVDFYVFDPEDPVVRTWRSIFPGVFKDRSEMPAALERHVRYPAGMLEMQGRVYSKYHMTDPEVFYNQEDLWVRATEKYYGAVQPVEPYYILWEPPGSDDPEFTLILPFTPKNRQVMIGWIAGMSDGENYGRFLAYKFPKEKRVLGPQQVETKIDQDSHLSGQLTLWDQRGSSVIRGNVLAIPIEDILLYVEPIYLKSETAAYPELRLVVLMHNDTMTYGESFDEALRKLIEGGEGEPDQKPGFAESPDREKRLIRSANRAFENYLERTAEKQFVPAAKSLEKLEKALKSLMERTGVPGKEEPAG
jgi:hypothetical protein